MRSLCTWFAGAAFTGALVCLVPGCGGESELAKTPEVKKQMNPETDMPGYKDMQEKLKKEGKVK